MTSTATAYHLDPWTTTFDPATSTVQSHAVPGNIIPAGRFDPVAASLLQPFWDPNNPGDNITGVNNFRVGFFQTYNYYNFSERVDYNINDNWRALGRIGRYYTRRPRRTIRRPTTRSFSSLPAR